MEINKKIYQIFDIIADFIAYLGFAQFISFLITVLFANKNELMLFCDLILFAVFLYILNKRIIFERNQKIQILTIIFLISLGIIIIKYLSFRVF